jgi:flavin reductase (DIM6/NTAB) family NADH-FMN oxidoreductase RutF
MQLLDPLAVAPRAMAQIQKGALLTVASGASRNTMTIGWAAIGFCWRRPVLMVAVRDSRHTFTLMETAADFTVSVPTRDLKEVLTFCGTQSGRDVDKFQALGLDIRDGLHTRSPVIDAPAMHFECRIVFKAPMDPEHLGGDLAGLYPAKDYHTLYFGDILACYET